MSDFLERMERLKVSAQSPDRCVTAKFTITTGVEVKLAASTVRRHTEESLAEQVTAAVNGVFAGCRQGTRAALSRPETDKDQPGNPQREAAVRQRRFAHEVSEMETQAISPLGCAAAWLVGEGTFHLQIAPGTLHRLDVDDARLQREINNAIAVAMREHAAWKRQVHEHVYQYQPYGSDE
ncbi:MAG: hypothetical protein ACRD0P_02820 [Stackebrandtia sp.]